MQRVRNSVTENALSNPDLIPPEAYKEYILQRGKAWVCEVGDKVVGFSVLDLLEHNIWALFLDPDHEKQGIGRQLHDNMLNWYFSHTKTTLWLGTAPATRAESFYKKAGWTAIGKHGKNEIKFEMTYANWISLTQNELG